MQVRTVMTAHSYRQEKIFKLIEMHMHTYPSTIYTYRLYHSILHKVLFIMGIPNNFDYLTLKLRRAVQLENVLCAATTLRKYKTAINNKSNNKKNNGSNTALTLKIYLLDFHMHASCQTVRRSISGKIK
ncbi:hypothetical protein GQX74_008281 [Glossina fuscipes]|nr:hypothetical protein GQX74_008281 [Glossina fuscipes]